MSREMPDRQGKLAQSKLAQRKLAAGPSFDAPLAAAVAAVPLVFVVASVPLHLLLPAVALLAFAAAAMTATFGWAVGASFKTPGVTVWDFAGACAFVGIAAAMFSKPAQVLQLFGAVATVS